MKNFYEDDNFKVWWHTDSETAILERKPSPYVKGEAFQVAILKLLDLCDHKKAKKYLFNALHVRVASNEDQDWLEQEFYPRIKEIGVKYSAVVMPRNILGRISIESMSTFDTDHPYLVRKYFENLEEAYTWLKSV
jgi:hypothetical protein